MSETNETKPQVYVVLGLAGSGRREIIADLIDGGLDQTDQVAVLVADTEAAARTELTPRLPHLTRWVWDGTSVTGEIPVGSDVVFFLCEGRSNPIDQIEAIKPWLAAQNAELVRVITVMHCELTSRHEALLGWYDACIHFSDVLLLHRREGVSNKWISDLRTRLQKSCLPVLVEMLRKGRIANPALILDPQVRRMTHWFDADDPWMAMIDVDTEIVIEDEGGQTTPVDELDELNEQDPYLARRTSGRRFKQLPDVGPLLDETSS